MKEGHWVARLIIIQRKKLLNPCSSLIYFFISVSLTDNGKVFLNNTGICV